MTTGRFALFADCLLVSLLVAAAALPVVTAYPAFTAGCALLRDRVAVDRTVGLRAYAARFREVARGGPAPFVVPPLLGALLAADALAVAAGVPGRTALTALLLVTGAAAAVVGLRAAARWRPGTPWRAAARTAAKDGVRDPAGSALLLLAAGAAVSITVLVPVTALLLPGPLALATLAVDGRIIR